MGGHQMKFVTKKEFEDALATIQSALQAGQIKRSLYNSDISVSINELYFTSHLVGDNFKPTEISFVSGSQAIKDRLHSIRTDLKMKRESLSKNTQDLEHLEKEEKQLVITLTTLKE